MRVQVSTMAAKQFKMYLPEEQVASLEEVARRFNRRSGQQVAEEILMTYLFFWEQAEQVKLNKVEEQREKAVNDALASSRASKQRMPPGAKLPVDHTSPDYKTQPLARTAPKRKAS